MPPSLLLRVLAQTYRLIDELGASPVVAGGLAVAYWGHPRSTQDINLAILVTDSEKFETGLRRGQLMPAKGGRTVELGFVSVSQWVLTLADEFIDCEIDLLISDSDYHQAAIGRALPGYFSGMNEPLRVLSCEDLLIFKLAAGRLIDLADIRTLVELNRSTLDYPYLRTTAEQLGLSQEYWNSSPQ